MYQCVTLTINLVVTNSIVCMFYSTYGPHARFVKHFSCTNYIGQYFQEKSSQQNKEIITQRGLEFNRTLWFFGDNHVLLKNTLTPTSAVLPTVKYRSVLCKIIICLHSPTNNNLTIDMGVERASMAPVPLTDRVFHLPVSSSTVHNARTCSRSNRIVWYSNRLYVVLLLSGTSLTTTRYRGKKPNENHNNTDNLAVYLLKATAMFGIEFIYVGKTLRHRLALQCQVKHWVIWSSAPLTQCNIHEAIASL